jgi:CHASE2 domain-containing sensor protein
VTTVGRRRVPRFTLRDALVAGIAGVVAALVLVLYFVSALGDLERASIDTRFSVRGAKSPGTDIVVIAIDQKTLTALNVQPPIPRADYAQVLDRIHAAALRLIAIDTQFVGRSHPADDRALLGAIARDGPIILATHEGDQGPIPVPAGVGGARGAIPASAAIDTDPDGVLRRMLFAPVQLPTLAVRAAELIDGRSVKPFSHQWIDFNVMAGTVPAAVFAGKTVLIGTTDPVNDVFVTSIDSDTGTDCPRAVHVGCAATAASGTVVIKAIGAVALVVIGGFSRQFLALDATPPPCRRPERSTSSTRPATRTTANRHAALVVRLYPDVGTSPSGPRR